MSLKRITLMVALVFFLTTEKGWTASPYEVNTPADSGAGSFREALQNASSSAGNTVTFSGVNGLTTALTAPNIPLNNNIFTIDTTRLPSGFIVDGGGHYGTQLTAGIGGVNITGDGILTFTHTGQSAAAFQYTGTDSFSFTLSSGTMDVTGYIPSVGGDYGYGLLNSSIGTVNVMLSGGTMNITGKTGSGIVFGSSRGFINQAGGTINATFSGATMNIIGNRSSGAAAGVGWGLRNEAGGTINVTFSSGTMNVIGNTGPTNNAGTAYGFYNAAGGTLNTNFSGGNMTITNNTGSGSGDGHGFYNNAGGTMTTALSGGSISATGGATAFKNAGTAGHMSTTITGGQLSLNNGLYVGNADSLAVSGTGIFSSGVNGATIEKTLLSFTSTATHQAAIGVTTMTTGGGPPGSTSQPVKLTTSSAANLGATILDVITSSTPTDLVGNSYTIMKTDNGSTITGTYETLTSSSYLVYSVDYNYLSGAPLSGIYTITVTISSAQSWAASQYLGPTATPNEVALAKFLESLDLASLQGDPAFTALNTYRNTGDTAGYDNALDQIQPSQLSALSMSNMNNMTALTGTTGGQVQAWLTDRGTSQGKIQGTAFAAGLSTLEPERLAAFNHLVTQSLTDIQGILALAPSATYAPPQRKGIVPRMGFTNSPEQLNRHVEAGRIQVGKANVWVQPYGQLTSQTGDGNGNPSIKTQTGGIVFGGDYEVTPNTLIGVLGGTSNTPFTWVIKSGKWPHE